MILTLLLQSAMFNYGVAEYNLNQVKYTESINRKGTFENLKIMFGVFG